MTDRARRSWVPGLLALIGGGAIVAGTLLTWLKIGGGVSVETVSVTGTPKGSELLLGQVALGVGVAVAILGLLLLAIRRARRLLGFFVVVGGIIAIAIAAFVASSPRDRFIDFATQKGASADKYDEVRASLANLFEVSGQETDLGVGLYVVGAGGIVSVVGGLAAFLGRRKPRPSEEAPEPSEPEGESLPEEWLTARAEEVAARSDAVEEPPARELVTQPAGPMTSNDPAQSDDAAPWMGAIPDESVERAPEEDHAARAEEPIPASHATEEPPAPEPITRPAGQPNPTEPPRSDDRVAWTRPLPDAWVAKAPAKRRFRRRS